jgi:hexosaminidase
MYCSDEYVFNSVQEIDTPGHTAVISKAHPEHVACAEATPWSTYANEPPAGQLRLASPSTVNFTVGMLSSVAGMFPSTLFSTGGDEINAQCYADDAQTQRDLNGRTLEQALDAFTQATHGALKDLGKTPVVWEGATYPIILYLYGVLRMFCLGIIEMVLNYNLTLSDDTIAMYVTGHLSPTVALMHHDDDVHHQGVDIIF